MAENTPGTENGANQEPDTTTAAKPAEKKDGKKAEKHAKKAEKHAKKAKACPLAHKTTSLGVAIAVAVVCLVCGGLIGRFVFGGIGAPLGTTELKESQLDTAIARFTYNGQTESVTAREAITQNGPLDSAKKEDGSYMVPPADRSIDIARNKIMQKVAQQRGITADDQEMSDYAKQYLGSDDYEKIASSYGMTADDVKKIVRDSCVMKKLRDSVVTEQIPDQPAAPSEPASGEEDKATAAYATYIKNLAGDAWDSEKGTWKDADSPFATALASYKITNDSATYAAARAAYMVAYQNYATASQSAANQWTDFVNGELCKATIQLSTLQS